MTQVKIYGLRDSLSPRKVALSDAIHDTLVMSFGLTSQKRFQRFLLLAPDEFIFTPHELRGRVNSSILVTRSVLYM